MQIFVEKKKKKRKSNTPDSDSGHDKPKSSDSGSVTTEDAVEDETDAAPIDKKPVDVSKQSIFDRVWEAIMRVVYEFLDDFTEAPDNEQNEEQEADALSPTKLKDNIKRFGAACKPYVNTVKGFYHLVTWKSPPYTLIVFIVYMYSVYMGWFLPVVLFCFSFRLFISYLRYRGWNINFNFFDPGEEQKDADDNKDLKVSAKFSLVLLVARKAQNILGSFADSLEKIKNLLTWRQPSATKEIFFKLICASIFSVIFPANYLFYIAGLYFGIKLFIIDYLFLRFPRLKQKYDSTHKIWLSLPTDAEFEKQQLKSEIDKYILPKRDNSAEQETDGIFGLSSEDRTFCELFSLPLEECPLSDWRGGRRCTLINRDKSLPSAFKNGKLFLTRSFLCFEKTKSPSPTNIVIPLSDITKLEKAKPYSWMPGGGMAIEIAVQGSDKTTIFGAILNRDEVFESIIKAGKSAGLQWASHSDYSYIDTT
ncbi:GRAM domain-containing protein 4-like isoform X2 [Gigantopelta aegis]|uniref:GRAM domain-containing protein 4-like isoform X2 n=1 Tax=Gigantopelta aegis TaxID=1735272 RepID=UPI001B88D9EB|nr:GRAM domain-containing protein 4-like isoform X2 [Gigantopelta aegis]